MKRWNGVAPGRKASIAEIRRATPEDSNAILRMVERDWRVHLRVRPRDMRNKLATSLGLIAEDPVGLRGFILLDSQPTGTGLLVAAGVRDTWGTAPYLDSLLPYLEEAARQAGLKMLVQIGDAPWLTQELLKRGFEVREWIVTFAWRGDSLPRVNPAIVTRSARRRDLPALLELDKLAFDPTWHKPGTNLYEALSRAISFAVVEMNDHLVGYEWSEKFGPHGHLTRLATHPQYQGRGIGARLLAQALRDLVEAGAEQITLNTQETNVRSQRLYRRYGFEDTGQRIAVLQKALI
ncbi:MAG: GNAT family N-acetyltransferase [Anaerolineae bacterium]